MKTVIINASPRAKGNSSYLSERLIEHFKDRSAFVRTDLRGFKISACTACRACKDKKLDSYCIIRDDFNALINEIKDADNIIFISPNHMGFISSFAKLFTDRFYSLKDSSGVVKFDTSAKKFRFILVQGSPNKEHANIGAKWANGFFARYGFDTKVIIAGGCKHDSHLGADDNFAEIASSFEKLFTP